MTMSMNQASVTISEFTAAVSQHCSPDTPQSTRYQIGQKMASWMRSCNIVFYQEVLLTGNCDDNADGPVMFYAAKGMQSALLNDASSFDRMSSQRWVHEMLMQRGTTLPKYVLTALYVMYAQLLAHNWRVFIIQVEEEGGDSTALGVRVIDEVRRLPAPLDLQCVTEMVREFSDEKRVRATYVRSSFATNLLPVIYATGVRSLQNRPAEAIQLLRDCLDFKMPPSMLPIVRVDANVSAKTIHLLPTTTWAPLIGETCEFIECSCHNAMNPNMAEVLALACQISTITTDVNYHEAPVQFFLDLTQNLVGYFKTTRDTEFGTAAARILCAMQDRHPHGCVSYFTHNREILDQVGQWFGAICNRWQEDEEESRELLLSFFASLCDVMDSTTHAIFAPYIQRALATFLEELVCHAYLEELSNEQAMAEATEINMEKYLLPVARLVLFRRDEHLPVVENAFRRCRSDYAIALRLKRGQPVEEEDIMTVMMLTKDPFFLVTSKETISAQLIAVTLSRLSVIIGVISAVMRLHQQYSSVDIFSPLALPIDEVSGMIASTARDLATEDPSDCFKSLSLSSISGRSSERSNPTITTHIGMLRSLFMYVIVAIESEAVDVEGACDTACRLITFVLRNEPGTPVLVHDALRCWQHMLSAVRTTLYCEENEDMEALVMSHCQGRLRYCSTVCNNTLAMKQRRLFSELMLKYCTNGAAEFVPFLNAQKDLYSTMLSQMDLPQEGAEATQPQWSRQQKNEALVITVLNDMTGLFSEHLASGSSQILIVWLLSVFDSIPYKQVPTPRVIHAALKLVARVAICATMTLIPDNYAAFPTQLCRWIAQNVSFCISTGMLDTKGYVFIARAVSSILGSSDNPACQWCNVGVMLLFGDRSVELMLLDSYKAIMRYDLRELTTHKDSDIIFDAIDTALGFQHASDEARSESQQLLPELARMLCTSVSQRLSAATLGAVHTLLLTNPRGDIPQDILKELLRNIVSQLIVSGNAGGTVGGPQPTPGSVSSGTVDQVVLPQVCDVLQAIYTRLPDVTVDQEFEGLIESSSVFYRVRLRALRAMLRNPPENLATTLGPMICGVGATQPGKKHFPEAPQSTPTRSLGFLSPAQS